MTINKKIKAEVIKLLKKGKRTEAMKVIYNKYLKGKGLRKAYNLMNEIEDEENNNE